MHKLVIVPSTTLDLFYPGKGLIFLRCIRDGKKVTALVGMFQQTAVVR